MGSGGCQNNNVAAATPKSAPTTTDAVKPTPNGTANGTTTTNGKANKNGGAWVSPFTPQRVDPKVSGMTLEEINKQFPTKSELRAVIPPHCFERSLFWSFYYVARDLLMASVVVYVTYNTLDVNPPAEGFFGNPLGWIAWRVGWNVYAIMMTAGYGGLWVIGHECGHGAFSDYPWVNDLVGWILHSSMLVPYFTWAYSHAKHHRRTNDLIEGETWVPGTHDEAGLRRVSDPSIQSPNQHYDPKYERLSKAEVDSKLTIFGKDGWKGAASHFLYGHALTHEHYGDEAFSFIMMWSRLLIGFQIYILGIHSVGRLGNDGKPIPKGTFPDHLRPSSRLFPSKMYWRVVLSDIGCLAVLAALIYCGFNYSWRAVYFWYVGPYVWINAALIIYTWLQHTDPTVPHFDAENWNWMKGALAGTIDRPLPAPFGVSLSHNIVTTHICHHLFHEIPHYHAVEATKHLRAYLEPKGLYNYDPTPMIKALWKVASHCHFVDSATDGVQYYHNFREVPLTTETTTKTTTTTQEESKKDN